MGFQMPFLYVLDPDGHRVEIYCLDYQTLDTDHEPIHWDLHDPQRQTLWDHQHLKVGLKMELFLMMFPSKYPYSLSL